MRNNLDDVNMVSHLPHSKWALQPDIEKLVSLQITIRVRCDDYPHFTEEKTEAWKG